MNPNDSPQTAATPEQTAWLPLPASWPGAFGAYKFSKQGVKLNANTIVGWALVGGAANIVLSIGLGSKNRIYKDALSYIIGSLVTAIITPALIAGVRQQPAPFGSAISKGIQFWLKIFVLGILVDLSLVASLILLIIPFFFVWPRLSLANYFLVDKNMGVVEAYKASWYATKGNVGYIYGILGAEVAMSLLAITIIGIPFSIYYLIMYSAVHALLYEMIIHQPVSAAADAAN